MACCLPTESVIRIELEEEIMEIEPPPTGESQNNTSVNKTTEENKTNDNEPQQNTKSEASKTKEHKRPVYVVIHQRSKRDVDSENETLVISDDEPDDPLKIVQRPAAAQTPAPVSTQVAVTVAMTVPQPREEVNPQEEQEPEAPSRKRMKLDNYSHSLPTKLEQMICGRQNNDKASSSTREATEKKEDAQPKQDANVDEGKPDTRDEKTKEDNEGERDTKDKTAKKDTSEAEEGSGHTKKPEFEELEGDIYGNSDDSTQSYYVYE